MAVVDADIVEEQVAPLLPMQGGGAVDIQVSTAKRFPRSIEAFIRRATEMATLTPEIAASCVYALPRDGKVIEGPSARLAEIVANAWGNLRIQAGADADTDTDSHFIVGYGEAWDVEANVAIRFEVRRRITNREGRRYNDDMVVVTGNAAASIALRNAVFKAVPSSFWRPIYLKCRQVIAGKAETFAKRRDEMLKAFNVMGVTNDRLYGAIGVKGLADITLDHMVQLTGFYNALKEGEISIEDAFPEGGGLGKAPIAMPQRKTEAQTSAAPTSNGTTTTEAAAATPSTTPADAEGVTIVSVEAIEFVKTRGKSDEELAKAGEKRLFWWLITTSDGKKFYTISDDIRQSCERLKAAARHVEMESMADGSHQFPKVVTVTPLGVGTLHVGVAQS